MESCRLIKNIFRICTLCFCILVCACATHTSKTQKLRTDWNAGNVGQSAKVVTKEVTESSETDKLIWLLEDGAISRANADFNKSITSFEKAYAQIQQYESQPATKLTEQTKALLTNQSYIPYKGYNYDKIMLCIYQVWHMQDSIYDELQIS